VVADLSRRKAAESLPRSARAHTFSFHPSLQMNEGAVIAVGPGRRSLTGDLIPVGVKAGDKVLLPEFGGVPVKLGDGGVDAPEYVVYRDEELLGVLTG